MFTILYKTGARAWDIPKHKLHSQILAATQEIEAVYERTTPVTQRVRKELEPVAERGTPEARRFISSQD